MKEEVFSQFTGGHLMIAAMVIFMAAFVVFVAWTYRRSARRYYKQMARLPLDEGDQHERT